MSGQVPLLDIRSLCVNFHTTMGAVEAVKDVSFHLHAGETLAILGESGSGKSVTASALMGIIDTPPGQIAAGEAVYHGQDLLRLSNSARRQINGRRVAMIFQDPLSALNPVYPVGWQIAETFRIHRVKSGRRREVAIDLMRRVGIPDPERRVDDYPHQFSGGQRQRIMIAMAIALEPDVLIADEPTTALDVTVQAQILKLLKRLQQETGMALLLITHDLGVVAKVADRVAVMQAGEIVETGPVRQVLGAPQHPYTQRLLAAVPGRYGFAAPTGKDEGDVILRVRNLVRIYGATSIFGRKLPGGDRALDDVSFTLHRGEVLGIVGESGSGKSTLARAVLGLDAATSGTVEYLGRDLARFTPAELRHFRRGIQAVFQDPTASLDPHMTVSEIISEAWEVHPDLLPRSERTARVSELLLQVGLEPAFRKRFPHQFSGGQRQRIAIARALALQPKVIVCDEAVSALDVSIQAQIIQLLRRLRDESDLTYIFIAHDLGVVRDFADRVLVMYQGRVVEEGPTAQVFRHPRNDYTRELLAASLTVEVAGDPAA